MPKHNGDALALLAEPIRQQIVERLLVRPFRPMHLAHEIGVSKFAISRHLAVLRAAGLVERRRSYVDIRGYLYALRPGVKEQATAWLEGTGLGDRPMSRPEFTRPSDRTRARLARELEAESRLFHGRGDRADLPEDLLEDPLD